MSELRHLPAAGKLAFQSKAKRRENPRRLFETTLEGHLSKKKAKVKELRPGVIANSSYCSLSSSAGSKDASAQDS